MSPACFRVFSPFRPAVAARCLVLGFAVLSAGCASKQASTYPGERLAGPPPQHQQQAWAAKVEIEDDGLPAQIAPRHRRPEPDDPREPWSPNYGTGKSGGEPLPPPAPAAAPGPSRQAALATYGTARSPVTSTGRTATTRLSAVDEDEIVRRAIAEHEMRRAD